jgi:guanylate kinase
MNGKLYIISAPSGAGKTTIINQILKKLPNLKFSISFTTRKKRINEVDGVDYYFIEKNKFEKMINQNELLEWAKVHNNYYGTPKKYIYDNINKGFNVLLDIDVQGADQVRKIHKDGIFIFIAPPTMEELEKRLKARKTENSNTLAERLKNAKQEMEYKDKYDYVVINDIIENAVSEIIKIICKTQSL